MKSLRGLAIAVLFASASAFAHAGHVHAPAAQLVMIKVTEDGFETKAPVHLKAGVPVKLVVMRKTEKTCAKQLVIADAGLKLDLPLNKKVTATFTPAKSGDLKYGCAMGMLGGVLKVE